MVLSPGPIHSGKEITGFGAMSYWELPNKCNNDIYVYFMIFVPPFTYRMVSHRTKGFVDATEAISAC